MADGTKDNAAADPKASEGADGTGFRPVTGGEEMQSGGRLLVEAYAAIWLILMVLVVFMWRRTRAIEARIAVLDQSVRRAEKGPGYRDRAAPAKSEPKASAKAKPSEEDGE